MWFPLCCVVDGQTTQWIARYVGWHDCHGGRCDDHAVADDVAWCCCHGGRCYDQPGCVCYLADVKANCGWCNYHRSTCILG